MANIFGALQSTVNLAKKKWKEVTVTIIDEGEETERRALDVSIRGSDGNLINLENLAWDNQKAVNLCISQDATGDTNIIDVTGYNTLVISIAGTSTSKTVLFQATGPAGIYQSIEGFKKLTPSTATLATSTTTDTSTTPEIWEFDVAGLTGFKCNISVIANGNVTINGVLCL